MRVTIENLEEYLQMDHDHAVKLYGLIRGHYSIDDEEFSDVMYEVINQVNHRPPPKEAIMLIANHWSGSLGVEEIDNKNHETLYSYINAGDMYTPTLMRDLFGDKIAASFFIASWEEMASPHIED